MLAGPAGHRPQFPANGSCGKQLGTGHHFLQLPLAANGDLQPMGVASTRSYRGTGKYSTVACQGLTLANHIQPVGWFLPTTVLTSPNAADSSGCFNSSLPIFSAADCLRRNLHFKCSCKTQGEQPQASRLPTSFQARY